MSMRQADQLRTCMSCKRTLPLDRFYSSGHGNGRRNTCTRCLNEALDRERRANGAKRRNQRYNARGHVWCNRCSSYLPPENFKRHPSRPGTFWAYCKPCVREIDRERYARKTSTLEGATAVLDSRLHRKRRQMKAERRERKQYVVHALDQILLRGFTRAEVARLLDVSQPTLNKWLDPKDPTALLKAAEERVAVVWMAVMDLPRTGYQRGRRLPHSEYARIHAITREEVASHYLRNCWVKKNGEKGRVA